MLPALRHLEAVGDWTAMRAELADMLGLDAPVPDEVLARARADDRYAGYLLRSSGHPDLLAILLKSPGNGDYRRAAPEPNLSSVALVAQAGKATLKWAQSGFQRVDEETYDRRFNACLGCRYLKEAPDKLVYKISFSPRSDPRICGACGCVASRKAAQPTASCPVEDPARPGWTFWQERVAQN